MPSEKQIVDVLDQLTIGGPEALATPAVAEATRLRRLLGSKNVVAVGVAEKLTAGKSVGTLALVFYVVRKLPLHKLNAAEAVPPGVPPGMSPHQIATDVIALGSLHLDKKKTPARKTSTGKKVAAKGGIQPGDSVAHFKSTAGTLGAIVKRGSKFELLSNSHVLALSGKARIGDDILCPGPADGGKIPQDVVGKLAKFHKLVKGGAFVNTVDCATAAVSPGRINDLQSAIKKLGFVPKGTTAPKRGMKIVKVGRTTGETTGTVRDVHFRFVFPYEGLGKVGFLDQVLCTRYSRPGDSGALVLEEKTRLAVGLHTFGAPEGSAFSPIDAVLSALGVELVEVPIA